MKFFSSMVLFVFFLALNANVAFATVLDFEDPNNLGVNLGGNMEWKGTGGGHLFMQRFSNNDFIYFFDNATYVNDFQMNAMPWEEYGGNGYEDLVHINAFNSTNEVVWDATIDLSNYLTWDAWETVTVNTADIAGMTFFATGYGSVPFNGTGFWPSIDNLRIDEDAAPVPEPATIILLGSGLAGLAFYRRKKK